MCLPICPYRIRDTYRIGQGPADTSQTEGKVQEGTVFTHILYTTTYTYVNNYKMLQCDCTEGEDSSNQSNKHSIGKVE